MKKEETQQTAETQALNIPDVMQHIVLMNNILMEGYCLEREKYKLAEFICRTMTKSTLGKVDVVMNFNVSPFVKYVA